MTNYEVESKFRVDDPEPIRQALLASNALECESVAQEDRYLSHPSRNFAETGEALRLRLDGSTNKITYKGAKLGGVAKTREEIEVTFEDGLDNRESLTRLFSLLGFQEVAIVRKGRVEFALERGNRLFHVAIDRAERLGSFVEVETIARGEADVPAAQTEVVALANELGLDQPEPRSYLRMLLESEGFPGAESR